MSAVRQCVLVLLLAACLAGAAADPALLSHVMPEAKVIMGINFSQVLSSPLGQFLLSPAQASDPQFQQFIQTTGFDPRRDLQEIVMASVPDPKQTRGLMLVRGVFDAAKLATLAQQAGGAVQSYKGVQIMGSKQQGQPTVAFLDSSTVALGDLPSIQGVIDRRGTGPGPDQALLARVHEVSGQYDLWVVSMVPPSDMAGKVPDEKLSGIMKGDVMQSILGTSGGMKFGSDILIAGEAVARSEKDAAALADVVRFLVGLAQMSIQKDPKAAASAAFLQRLDLRTEGNIMRLSLAIPEADLERVIEQAQTQAKQAAARARQAPAASQQPPPSRPSGDLIIQSSPKDMGTVVIK